MPNHKHTLEQIVNERQVKCMAELGVYKGYTTRHLLDNCKSIERYFAVDMWKAFNDPSYGRYLHMSQTEWNERHEKLCQFMLWYPALHVVKMSSVDFAKKFNRRNQFFDFVYIDTSHFYEDTKAEIKAYLPLVKKGGVIGGHDYGRNVRAAHQGVKIAVDEYFGEKNIHTGKDMVWWTEV